MQQQHQHQQQEIQRQQQQQQYNIISSPPPPIRSFMMSTDLTPTILDYASVPQAGSTYEGREVHPIMGKSIRPLLNGSAEEIHGPDDPTGLEMFNNTALYKGPWVALMDNSHPTGKGWELYNIETDPGQNNNVADSKSRSCKADDC